MPKSSPLLSSFNAGEWSPKLEGRADQEKYANACRTLENFIPQIHGGLEKRPGTRHVKEVKDSTKATTLIPFEFSTQQAYILEFGDLYMRVYKDGGNVELSGSPYEIATPYAAADVADIQYAQSADVLYLAHPNYAPRKLSRTGDTAWTLTEIEFEWPPFISENIDESVTVYASAAIGTGVTLTASAATFTSDMVGGYVRLREVVGANHDLWNAGDTIAATSTRRYDGNVYYTTAGGTAGTRPPIHTLGTESDGGITDWDYYHSGEGYVKITGFTSTTVVTGDVVKRLPASVVGGANATSRWALGAWSGEYGYPTTVTFYEDRLLWAGSTNDPQTLWGSKTGDYENHQSGVNDDDAYSYTLNTDQVNAIRWLSPGKVLLAGTSGGEFSMRASSLEEAITPTNVRVSEETQFGSKLIKAVRVGNSSLFVQRAGKKVREMQYNFDSDSYQAKDVTLLSEHITSPTITAMAYQNQPDQILWAVRSDGVLLGFTYERTEQVFGWHRHPLGGDGKVKSVAVIPHPDGTQDQLWMIVERTINGATKKYVEYLEKSWDATNDIEDAFFVDSGLTYDGSAATTISGLGHLEGQSVAILADGSAHANKTVSGGAITLDRSASVVQVGLGYNATYQSMRIEAGAADGTAQGKTKRITNITIRMYQTGAGLWYGPDTTTMDEINFRDPFMAMDAPVPLYDGDKGHYPWPEGYEQDARVTLQHRLPLPCSILAIMPQLVTQDR